VTNKIRISADETSEDYLRQYKIAAKPGSFKLKVDSFYFILCVVQIVLQKAANEF